MAMAMAREDDNLRQGKANQARRREPTLAPAVKLLES